MKFKKLLAVLLSVIILFGSQLICILNVKAETTYTEGYYTYTIINSEAMITDCDTSICDAIIPSTLGGYPVTSIRKLAFSYCKSLTRIAIPEKIISIGENAFYSCNSLKNVYITDVEVWCNISFNGEYSNPLYYGADLYLNGKIVTDLLIPDSIVNIGSYTFFGCRSLISITIPNSVTNISSSAFRNCSSLESINVEKDNTVYHSNGNCLIKTSNGELIKGTNNSTIPADNSVSSIAGYSFSGCIKLKNITVPDSVTSISRSAFEGCSSLETITLPFVGGSKTPTTIFNEDGTRSSNSCFGYIFGASIYNYNNKYVPCSLKKVTLSNKCTSISEGAFYGCEELTHIIIPDTVTKIGENAFAYCSKLTNINIPNNLKSIEGFVFLNCKNLKSVSIPSSITNISGSAFYKCSGLTNINIPNSVINIGGGAFYGCTALETMSLPFIGGSVTQNTYLGYIFGNNSYSDCNSYVPTSLKKCFYFR